MTDLTTVGPLAGRTALVTGASRGIGYGVAEGGHAALHAMLASCANGITVVNIDNGYGAALAAVRILKRMYSS